MKSKKYIQKKFRIDNSTNKILKIILISKNVSLQYVLESLLKDYIYRNLEELIITEKIDNLSADNNK